MLSYDRLSGGYKLFRFERSAMGSVDPLGGVALAEGTVMARKKKYVYGGNDTLMELHPAEGRYRVFKCKRGADEDETPADPATTTLFVGTTFPCTLVGEGSVPAGPACNVSDHGECISNPRCGWCEDTRQCTTGGPEGPCKGECAKYDYGGSSPCATRPNCAECVSDSGCGFCESTGKCTEGAASGPQGGVCANWMYGSCTSEPCSTFGSCSKCSKVAYCGWCRSSGSCMEGSAEKPLYEECASYGYHDCAGAAFLEEA